MDEFEEIEFTVKCKMNRRWANQFLSMLRYFEDMGAIGHSCRVGFYANGDGDFRPEFTTDFDWDIVEPVYTFCGYNEVTYDADNFDGGII